MWGFILVVYKYTQNNLLDFPEKYFYAAYDGKFFIKKWYENRKIPFSRMIDLGLNLKEIQLPDAFEGKNKSSIFLDTYLWILEKIKKLNTDNFVDRETENFLKKFEVRKKIYQVYENREFVVNDKCDGKDVMIYIFSGYLFALCYKKTSKLQFLNSCLKIMDIIVSYDQNVKNVNHPLFLYLLKKEFEYIRILGHQCLGEEVYENCLNSSIN